MWKTIFIFCLRQEDYFESIIEYEKEKVKKNLFMSDESADAVISQIHEFTKAKANNSLIATFEDRDFFCEKSYFQ